jgi:hypothetical protein
VRLGALVAERGYSVCETENLVRKSLKGEGGQPAKRPELSVISEALKTKTVHVQLHQRAAGAARIVIDVLDAKSRDAMVEAIKKVAE